MRMPTREEVKSTARGVWWVVTIAVLAAYLSSRWIDLKGGKATAADVVLFLVLVGVWLLPLAREVKLWGLYLRKDIAEVRREIGEVRTEVRLAASAKAHVQIGGNQVAPDPVLRDILSSLGIAPAQEARAELTLRELTAAEVAEKEKLAEYEAPAFAIEAFRIRYNVEQELLKAYARIWPDLPVPTHPGKAIVAMEKIGLFSQREGFGAALREFMAVTKSAMRGIEPSPSHIEFLDEVAPVILSNIRHLDRAKAKAKD